MYVCTLRLWTATNYLWWLNERFGDVKVTACAPLPLILAAGSRTVRESGTQSMVVFVLLKIFRAELSSIVLPLCVCVCAVSFWGLGWRWSLTVVEIKVVQNIIEISFSVEFFQFNV